MENLKFELKPYMNCETECEKVELELADEIDQLITDKESEISAMTVRIPTVLKALRDNGSDLPKFDMDDIAKAMGYKGISAKLSSTIEKMIEIGALEKVMVGAYVKLHIPGDI